MAQRNGKFIRAAAWAAVIAAVLAIPLIAMQFSNEVRWSVSDFVFAAALLGAVAAGYELAAARGDGLYRLAAGVALATAFLMTWINGAVGIIGDEGEPANLLFAGIVLIGAIGAALARFRPAGMSRAMLVTASAQALAGAVALAAGWGAASARSPLDIVGLSGFFTALWLLSAWLFRRAGRISAAELTAG